MITVTQHDFVYIPSEKKTEVIKTPHSWEGVPQNLIVEVVNILRYPTNEEKVMRLRAISPNIFHSELISNIVGITIGATLGIIKRNRKNPKYHE